MRLAALRMVLVGVVGLAMVATAAANGVAVPGFAISTESPASLGTVSFETDALVAYNPTTDVAALVLDVEDEFSGINRNLDAAYIFPNGDVVISTQAGDTAGGVSFTESDLVLLDRANGTVSMFLDASAVGLNNIGSVPNINAVHVLDNGNVLFSTAANSGVDFKGVTYHKHDIIEYDPINDTGSLFFDGDLLFLGSNGFEPDIQGLAVIDNDHILIAANDDGVGAPLTLGGITFTRDDLVLYNPTTNTSTLHMEGENEFSEPGEIIDAVALAEIPEPASSGMLAFAGALLLGVRTKIRS